MKPLLSLILFLLAPLAPAADDIGGDAVPDDNNERFYKRMREVNKTMPLHPILTGVKLSPSLPNDLLEQLNSFQRLDDKKLKYLHLLFAAMSKAVDNPSGFPETWKVSNNADIDVLKKALSKETGAELSDQSRCGIIFIVGDNYFTRITIFFIAANVASVERSQYMIEDGLPRPFVGDRSKVAKPAEEEKALAVKPEGKAE